MAELVSLPLFCSFPSYFAIQLTSLVVAMFSSNISRPRGKPYSSKAIPAATWRRPLRFCLLLTMFGFRSTLAQPFKFGICHVIKDDAAFERGKFFLLFAQVLLDGLMMIKKYTEELTFPN
ncbi:MAG: hypothetical protein QM496_02825 [Verrucomicrobiota bacterium]